MTEFIYPPIRRPEASLAAANVLNLALTAALRTWTDNPRVIPMRSGRRMKARDIADTVNDAIAARHLGFTVSSDACRPFQLSLINAGERSQAVLGIISPAPRFWLATATPPVERLRLAFRAISTTCDLLLELKRRGTKFQPLFPPLPPGKFVHLNL